MLSYAYTFTEYCECECSNVDCCDQECRTEYETSYEQQCSTSYVTECEAATPTYGSTSSGYGSPAAPKCSQKPQQSCQQVNILDRALNEISLRGA